MFTQKEIVCFLNNYSYDIRLSKNGRWIDQKCTADVLSAVADCVHNYLLLNAMDESFISKDIWMSKYAVDNIEVVFKKPSVNSEKARNEYDKFFQQPLEMLVAANILDKNKIGNRNVYHLKNKDMLEYIALREKNALCFLKEYIEKTLTDSGIIHLFNNFFDLQSSRDYRKVKNGFRDFIILNTAINTELETNRIFSKVINPLAYYLNKKGTEKGTISKDIITYDMLMYNRNNFRDLSVNKPKGLTRKEYIENHPIEVNKAYYDYQSNKAKKFLRVYNDTFRGGVSEYTDGFSSQGRATNIHHIFPKYLFPEISFYLENLIALTPTQHYNGAHNDAKTSEINEQYQHLLLLAKAERIKENILDECEETVYDFDKFLFVLKAGFDMEDECEPQKDFSEIINIINQYYMNQ